MLRNTDKNLSKYTNKYHIESPIKEVPNPVINDAFYALEYYYIEALQLPRPKLIHLGGFGFHLNNPAIRPDIEGDVICYSQSVLFGNELYQLLMYALENNLDSFHIALIVNEQDKNVHQMLKQGCIEYVEKYNRLKHAIRLFNIRNPKYYKGSVSNIIKEYLDLNGAEFIPKYLPDLILNTEIHVFEHPGILIM